MTHSSEPNAVLICQICGTRNQVISQTNNWVVTGVSVEPEKEIRERTDEFARLRNYRFNELQERIIQALIRKREKNGDFFCPCKARLVLENVCPCKETRDGAVEDRGRCTCGLFWKQNPSVYSRTENGQSRVDSSSTRILIRTFGVSLAYWEFTQMNSSTRVKIYTGDFCPICEIVERYLSEKDVKYVKINVDEDPVGREEFLKLGYENFPVIDIEGTTVLGYNVEAIDKALREKGITH